MRSRDLTTLWTRTPPFTPADLYCSLRSASKQEIIKAYRKLAQQWHPDNFQSEAEKKEAEKKFIDIASAKEVLTDPGLDCIYISGILLTLFNKSDLTLSEQGGFRSCVIYFLGWKTKCLASPGFHPHAAGIANMWVGGVGRDLKLKWVESGKVSFESVLHKEGSALLMDAWTSLSNH